MPVDLLHRAPDRLPLYASPDGFESAVPENVRALVRESAFVWEVETTPDASIIHHRTPTKPCRHIYIGFEKDMRRSRTGMIYALSDAKRSWRIKKGKLVPVIRQNFDPDVPPTDESFRIWTAQSINRTVLNRLRDIGYELRLAAGLNATYVTESEFEGLLIGTETDPSPRTRRNSAVNFLNAIAPFNSNATPETVAAIRQDKPKLFELFQGNLIHWAAQLKDTDGDFEDRARGLYTKEIAPLVKAINDQFTKAVVQSGSSVVLAGAGVVALAVTKFAAAPLSIPLAIGFGALAAAQAVGQAMPSVAEYRQKKKDIAYVWARLAGS